MGNEFPDFYGDKIEKLDRKEKNPEIIILEQQLELERLKRENLQLQLELREKGKYNWKGKLDHGKSPDYLPENVGIKVLKGSIYYNGKISHDYHKEIEKVILSENLQNGINISEGVGEITLDFGKIDMGKYNTYKKEKVSVFYEGEHLVFEYKGNKTYILLKEENKYRPVRVIFGDKMSKRQIQNKDYGSFLEFKIKLDWR